MIINRLTILHHVDVPYNSSCFFTVINNAMMNTIMYVCFHF